MRFEAAWGALAGIAIAACIEPGSFFCEASVQCVLDDVQGTCTRVGRCSFPAEDCPSGARYSPHAGDALAGTCVAAEDLSPPTDTGMEPPAHEPLFARFDYTHDVESRAYSYVPAGPETPADLTAPVDYAHGQLHARLEVRSKPSDMSVGYQVCLYQDPLEDQIRRACTRERASFAAVGVHELAEPVADLEDAGSITWDQPLAGYAMIVRDGNDVPVDDRWGLDGKWVGSPDLALYYPMDVTLTIVVVPPGGTFPGWDPPAM